MAVKKQSWRDLKVWEKSHQLVKDVYKHTASFPREEIYGLTSQIRRSAISVPSNIVEGNSRKTTRDYVHFLYTSRGSLEELRYQLLLSQELTFLSTADYDSLENRAIEISKMLNSLIVKLEARVKG